MFGRALAAIGSFLTKLRDSVELSALSFFRASKKDTALISHANQHSISQLKF